MKRNFYFFRHGQTNENEAGAREGNRVESFLTDAGIRQAKRLAEYLSDKNLDVIYSSPLKRAVHTAEIVAERHPGIKIITDDDLIEAAFGFWYNDRPEVQQRVDDNYKRIKECLDRIVSQSGYKDVAISSHGGVTRALCYAAGVKIGNIKNCQCFHFVLDSGNWQFIDTFETGIEVVNKSDIPQE